MERGARHRLDSLLIVTDIQQRPEVSGLAGF
jgi:hypothetical protein